MSVLSSLWHTNFSGLSTAQPFNKANKYLLRSTDLSHFWAKTNLRTELSLISLMDDVMSTPQNKFQKILYLVQKSVFPILKHQHFKLCSKMKVVCKKNKKTPPPKICKMRKKARIPVAVLLISWLTAICCYKAAYAGLARAICWSHRRLTISAVLH